MVRRRLAITPLPLPCTWFPVRRAAPPPSVRAIPVSIALEVLAVVLVALAGIVILLS
jgi:hypothetical protein